MATNPPLPAFALFPGDHKLLTVAADGRKLGATALHVAASPQPASP